MGEGGWSLRPPRRGVPLVLVDDAVTAAGVAEGVRTSSPAGATQGCPVARPDGVVSSATAAARNAPRLRGGCGENAPRVVAVQTL